MSVLHRFVPIFLLLTLSLATLPAGEEEGAVSGEERFEAARQRLVERYIVGAGITDEAVIGAMLAVPRHEFVLPESRKMAYEDRALPINAGQTISQPFVVAFMTEMLELEPGDKVLEVGCGSGYQAAVLAETGATVYSMEIIDSLAQSAAVRLESLGYDLVTVVSGDGYFGLPEDAPFDAVIVTAAAGHVPPPLVEQLKSGGRMIIPVGPVYSVQSLILVRKDEEGSVTSEQLLPVRFVPMTGRVQVEER